VSAFSCGFLFFFYLKGLLARISCSKTKKSLIKIISKLSLTKLKKKVESLSQRRKEKRNKDLEGLTRKPHIASRG